MLTSGTAQTLIVSWDNGTPQLSLTWLGGSWSPHGEGVKPPAFPSPSQHLIICLVQETLKEVPFTQTHTPGRRCLIKPRNQCKALFIPK